MGIVSVAIRFVLGITFVLAGLPKILRRAEFEDAVRRYDLLRSVRAVGLVASLLPLFELAVGASLLIGFGGRVAAVSLVFVLLVFTSAVAANLLRGRDIDCGCLTSVSPRKIGWSLVMQDLALAAGAGFLVWAPAGALSVDHLVFGAASRGVSDAHATAVALTTLSAIAVFALAKVVWRYEQLHRSLIRDWRHILAWDGQ